MPAKIGCHIFTIIIHGTIIKEKEVSKNVRLTKMFMNSLPWKLNEMGISKKKITTTISTCCKQSEFSQYVGSFCVIFIPLFLRSMFLICDRPMVPNFKSPIFRDFNHNGSPWSSDIPQPPQQTSLPISRAQFATGMQWVKRKVSIRTKIQIVPSINVSKIWTIIRQTAII